MRLEHPALEFFLQLSEPPVDPEDERNVAATEHATSVSLARVLGIGLLSRLDPNLTSINIWDPASGVGRAGSLLAESLTSVGVEVRYRGQDINADAVSASKRRFKACSNAEIVQENTLTDDAFPQYAADLVLVDPPWKMSWSPFASAIESRQHEGAYTFGLPERDDSSWLFISLALEKLRSSKRGGGRVAALIAPSALSSGGAGADVRRRIVEAGLLES